jgi:hypothetical protein
MAPKPRRPAPAALPVKNGPLASPIASNVSSPVAALASALVPVRQPSPVSVALAVPAAARPSFAPVRRLMTFCRRIPLEVGVFGDLLVGGTNTRHLAATANKQPTHLKALYAALPQVAPTGAVMGDAADYVFAYTIFSDGTSSCSFSFWEHHWLPACADEDPAVSSDSDLKAVMATALICTAAA